MSFILRIGVGIAILSTITVNHVIASTKEIGYLTWFVGWLLRPSVRLSVCEQYNSKRCEKIMKLCKLKT